MSTEPQTTPAAESPSAALKAGWTRFKRGEVVSYRIMALLLLLGAAGLFFLYMWVQSGSLDSKIWTELDGSASEEELEAIAKNHSKHLAGKIAEMQLARGRLGQEGISQLVTGDEGQRKRALAAIELAKASLTDLAKTWEDVKAPVLQAECYLGLAKAELALVGITKDNRIDQFLGSTARAAEWLDKLAAVADGTPWGDDAKKTAAELRKSGGTLGQEMQRLQTGLYNMTLFPGRPGGMFGGPGGFGGMPFSPGGLPIGADGMPMIPGLSPLPGGGPVAPGLPPGHP